MEGVTFKAEVLESSKGEERFAIRHEIEAQIK
jgi:hypothetical protein